MSVKLPLMSILAEHEGAFDKSLSAPVGLVEITPGHGSSHHGSLAFLAIAYISW